MKIDLHNHTNHSDGVYTPLQLLQRAEERKVDVFALTDHDSVFGCDEITRLGKTHRPLVLKGMELSTDYKNESVHIVCLFKKNIIPTEIIQFSKDNLVKRKERAIQMMQKIQENYSLKMNIDELLSENEIITRANMLRNIAKYNNLTLKEASFYVSKDSKGYIPSTELSVEDGLALARSCGCIVILAHPCLLPNEYIDDILKFGFDGIEARYPSKKNDEQKFRDYAEKYNLFISAGSDCHGDSTHADIGTSTLCEDEFLVILKKLELEEEYEKWKLNLQSF